MAEKKIQQKALIGCRDCGLLQYLPGLEPGMAASCHRCQAPLAERPKDPILPVLVWALAALLLCVPALLSPIFIVSAAGIVSESPVTGTVNALDGYGFAPLGILVAAFAIVVPVVWLGSLSVVMGCLLFHKHPAWLGRLFRLAQTIDIWAMPDVFLLGGFVAYTRLGAVANVTIGTGGWAYTGLAFAVMMIRAKYDGHYIWHEILFEPKTLNHEAAIFCPKCVYVLPQEAEGDYCPRCSALVLARKPDSIVKTACMVMAAYLLYIPANLLPVLDITRFGREQPNTILGGALELIKAGMWPLAMIVFLASIAVPVMKLFGLSWFLLSTRHGSEHHLVARTRLYRVIGAIGRWSNIDVFMVALLAALVKFGNLTTIEPEPGAVAFASVVVITMLASHSFDSRLMWDAANKKTV